MTEMNKELETLIEQLADKFGTTAEHLWSVLVYQAPITGAVQVISFALFATVSVWTFKWIRHNTTKQEDQYHPNWEDEGAFLAWCLWAIPTVILSIIALESAPQIIAAFFNPEYWALKQLIP